MKKQATYGDYVITINDDSSVSIIFQNEECSNAKKTLREVSEKVGFAFDAGWNTRQFGSKLVDFLKTNAKYEATSMQQEAKKTITFTIFGKEIEIFEITENGMGDSYGGLVFYPWEMAIDGQMLSDDDVDDIYCQSEEAQEDWKHSEQLSGEVIGLKRYENKASYSCQIEVDGEFDHSKLFVSWMEMTLCIEGKGSYTEDESLISGVVIKYNLDVERSEGSDCEVVWGIDSEEDDDSEEEENAAASLSVSEQFAILAYHIANLDGEVKKDELDMIVMVVQNFDVFEGPEVMGRLMQERMGINQYDVDDVLYAVRDEHHVTMFQALAMVSVSDFNLTKEKKNILHVLSEAWDLREDKCNEFLGGLIEQVNEAYPGKLVIE